MESLIEIRSNQMIICFLSLSVTLTSNSVVECRSLDY